MLRNRNGIWHYRFKVDGREYSGSTGLAATSQNRTEAQDIEADHRKALLEGRNPSRRILIRQFSDAAGPDAEPATDGDSAAPKKRQSFLTWAEVQYREHPNSYKRIATSFVSAKEFFGTEPVSLIDDACIEAYKVWRLKKHNIREITLRHDLHALSTFFEYAKKQRWSRENPVRNVDIPSDKDAVRIHVITTAEEKLYFSRAAKRRDLYDVARLILNQGLRPDEITSQPRSDVDLERGLFHVRKGKTAAARRALNLTNESRLILARRATGLSRWLFPSPRRAAGPLQPGGIDNNIDRHITRLNNAHDAVCAETGLSFVLYDFRHTFATRMAQAGCDLATLAAILGHSSLRQVLKYVHPTAEHQRVAMLKYEGLAEAEVGGTREE